MTNRSFTELLGPSPHVRLALNRGFAELSGGHMLLPSRRFAELRRGLRSSA